MTRGTLTLALAGMILALAGPVAGAEPPAAGAAPQLTQAQAAPTQPASGMEAEHKDAGDRHMSRQQRLQKMCDGADARHQAMMERFEARLKLTDAQKPLWTKVVAAATAAHQAMMSKMCADLGSKPRRLPLPERLAHAEEMAQSHLAQLQALRPAVEELYKALSPEQQKIADSLPIGSPGHGHRHGEHGHHHD